MSISVCIYIDMLYSGIFETFRITDFDEMHLRKIHSDQHHWFMIFCAVFFYHITVTEFEEMSIKWNSCNGKPLFFGRKSLWEFAANPAIYLDILSGLFDDRIYLMFYSISINKYECPIKHTCLTEFTFDTKTLNFIGVFTWSWTYPVCFIEIPIYAK